MATAAAAFGVLLVAVANYDALVTTIAVGSGKRPLTAYLARGLRRLLRAVPRLLPAGGPVVVLATVATWIALLWVGYTLVFAADAGAVTDATTAAPASAVSRAYFVGYTLFTLGNGGYAPAVGVWEIATALVALNGLFVVTLAITYMVPVVSAVVERRQFAALINALGSTAEEVVASAWNGRDFSYLEQQLPTVAQQVLLTAQRHLAYPVLHDFRSSERHAASERTLALLDEAVTLVEHGVAEAVRLPPPLVRTVRFAVDEACRLMPLEASTEMPVPPPPDLTALVDAGIPTVPQSEFVAAVDGLVERRRHLALLVRAAGWQWPNRPADRS